MSGTERVTLAAAIVRFLKAQRIRHDDVEDRLFHGVFGIFGHGNVAGLGQALDEHGEGLPFYQPKNEQGGVHAAIAFASRRSRTPTGHSAAAYWTSCAPSSPTWLAGATSCTWP